MDMRGWSAGKRRKGRMRKDGGERRRRREN